MAKSWQLSLLAVVLVSASQAASVLSPELNINSVSGSSVKDKFSPYGLAPDDGNNIIYDASDDNNIVPEILDESADDVADDNEVEKELTEKEKKTGKHIEFPVDEMDEEELKMYLDLEEQIFWAEADEHIAFQLLKDKRSLFTKGGDRLRKKRIVPLIARAAFVVARGLARRFARSGVTRSGSRVTRHYNGRGSYSDAARDFDRMRPSNTRGFTNGRISGRTGTMGNHRVTVRDGSSGNSRPTLEIRSHGGDLVRKFRYID